jgi:hypothetical protein
MFTTGWHGERIVGLELFRRRAARHPGRIPVHQASILFTFMVLVMGAVWFAMTELGGEEILGDPPTMVASVDHQTLSY